MNTCRAALLSLVFFSAPAIVAPAPAQTGVPVRLELRLRHTPRSGSTSTPMSVHTCDALPGRPCAMTVWGSDDGGGGAGALPTTVSDAWAWRAETTRVAVSDGTTRFGLRWQRLRLHAGRQIVETTVDGPQEIGVGDERVLDLARTARSTATVENIVVAVAATLANDGPTGAALAYDLWLVHEKVNGQRVTRQIGVSGLPGMWTPYVAGPIGFDLSGAPRVPASTTPLLVNVSGRLRGIPQNDGAVSITAETVLSLVCERAGERSRTSGGGVRRFTTTPGETTAIELPAHVGSCTVRGQMATGGRPGLASTPDGVRVTSGPFFGNDRFSLLVTVRRP